MSNPDAKYNKNLLNLESSSFLNTFNQVDWNDVINTLIEPANNITIDPAKWKLEYPGYKDIFAMWQEANFNMDAVRWKNYYSGTHYDERSVEKLAEYLQLNGIHRSWISKIDPGYFAPWHWDVDDNEAKYLEKGEIFRFSVFIQPPHHGHIFIINNDYLFNIPQGTIFKWNYYKDWHAGINAGMTPKYMLHLVAY
jgi:hypothetical protein